MWADEHAALLRELLEEIEARRPVAMATVVDTHRSVPRHPGARMLVEADGRTVGTVGGGGVEARVVAEALAALADGRPRMVRMALVDPAAGDPGVCGGELTVAVEPFRPAPTVFVVGCGHVGRAVVELADWLGYRVVATDDRVEQVTAEALPGADVLLPGPIEQAVAREPLTADTHVVVVTRDHDTDVRVLPTLLAGPCRSIGVIGSARRWRLTRQALAAAGVPEAALDRVSSPIGIDIGAETPREIALAVLAGLVARDRTGPPGTAPGPGGDAGGAGDAGAGGDGG